MSCTVCRPQPEPASTTGASSRRRGMDAHRGGRGRLGERAHRPEVVRPLPLRGPHRPPRPPLRGEAGPQPPVRGARQGDGGARRLRLHGHPDRRAARNGRDNGLGHLSTTMADGQRMAVADDRRRQRRRSCGDAELEQAMRRLRTEVVSGERPDTTSWSSTTVHPSAGMSSWGVIASSPDRGERATQYERAARVQWESTTSSMSLRSHGRPSPFRFHT